MADSILKPNTGNDLVLSNDDGSAKIEVNEGADIAITIGSSAGDDFNVGSGKLLVEGDSSLVSDNLKSVEMTLNSGGLQQSSLMDHKTSKLLATFKSLATTLKPLMERHH